MMLRASFALACTTVRVRGRPASATKPPASGAYAPLSSHPRSEVRVARQAWHQPADADQGIVFRVLSLSQAYLGAIEQEAAVPLGYLQTLPLYLAWKQIVLQKILPGCESRPGWRQGDKVEKGACLNFV